jgi:predicted AlkP superfamily pyrophosphatase or phosphodiesterase
MNFLGTDNGLPKIKVLQDELSKDYKNVVYIIVDGLGQKILDRNLNKTAFMHQNNRQTITTVFPSTTTNATTSILTANYPASHGWFAWSMNFGDRTIELFKNTDYYTGQKISDVIVKKQLPYKNFFEKPRKGISTYTLMPEKANVATPSENAYTHKGPKDMFKKLEMLCKQNGKKFIYSYFWDIDNKMHQCGPKSAKTKKMVKQLDKQFEKVVTENPGSLFVLTADHGHVDIKGFVDIYKDEDIIACLTANISLDTRATGFHIKSGMEGKFKSAFAKYSADFELFETSDLIARGVFGPFKGDKYKQFLGNFIAAGKDTGKMLVFAEGKQKNSKGKTPVNFRGHHTGLTENEMLVPLIISSC